MGGDIEAIIGESAKVESIGEPFSLDGGVGNGDNLDGSVGDNFIGETPSAGWEVCESNKGEPSSEASSADIQ